MRWLALLYLASCYSPTVPANVPCGSFGECPSGQTCWVGHCVTTIPDGQTSQLADAFFIDSPTDAPPTPPDPDAPVGSSGCADGQREAFTSEAAYPNIAGCAATWTGPIDLRDPKSNVPCGDDIVGECDFAADACAAGWHICGDTGDPTDVSSELTEAQCAAAGAQSDSRFVAAMSHCISDDPVCDYTLPMPCEDLNSCSEPVCCGAGCRTDAGCPDVVYNGKTRIAGSMTDGCGALLPTSATGVMCCM